MFRKNKLKSGAPAAPPPPHDKMNSVAAQPKDPTSTVTKAQLVFYCQLAHGSPTGLISGFSSVTELYQKIGEHYEFAPSEVSAVREFRRVLSVSMRCDPERGVTRLLFYCYFIRAIR